MSKKRNVGAPNKAAADVDSVAQIATDNSMVMMWQISQLTACFVDPFYGEVERSHGVSKLQFFSLFCLANVGELSAQQLILIRPKNSVSAAVHSLLRKRFIRRRPDPKDGRQAILALTRRGQECYNSVLPRIVSRQNWALSCLSQLERSQLERLLGKVVRHVAERR